ncbi:MAG: phage tail sheath family protein [Solirubrobacteraceae bacterium]
MPTYLTPGVYVEEVPSTSKPIEGVSTSIAAFVGLAPGGPINTPMRISNWTQFAKIFGDSVEPENGPFMEGAYLAHSVYGFFQNGGNLCWIVRVGQADGGPAALPQAALPAAADSGVETLRILALPEVDGQVKVEVSESPVIKNEGDGEGDKPAGGEPTYSITISGPSAAAEKFEGLTLKKGRNNIATKINAASKLVRIEETGSALPEAQRAPASGTYVLSAPSVAAEKVEASDFAGDVARRRGMGGLAAVDEITMVVIPDLWAISQNGNGKVVKDLQGKLIAHCENAGDRMAILDAPDGMLPQDVLDWRMNDAGYDSKYAALYWPWIEVMNPLTNKPLTIPPSGHVAGVWCRTDATRGVHKAPANEVTLGANSVAFQITHAEQGSLNKAGINCIRAFPGRGIRIWGARTLSSDPEWRYINVRRLFNYVSESIMQGTQWSVFEPNDQKLWIQLRIAASSFLTRTWRDGALFGASPEQAFFVKCDEETNPPDVIEAGQVVCEIGIAPVKPAEFVIFRLSQYADGGGEIEA